MGQERWVQIYRQDGTQHMKERLRRTSIFLNEFLSITMSCYNISATPLGMDTRTI
jgi:hypothetical protein